VNRQQAGYLVGRLSAQWPSIADTDLGADDWVNALVALDYERGVAIVDQFLHGWTRDRPPRLADWQEAARDHARRVAITEGTPRRRLDPGPPTPGERERVAALIDEARRAIAAAQSRRSAARPDTPARH
jgi:hypothetical protein